MATASNLNGKLFLVMGSALLLAAIPAWVLGWKWESGRQFLKSYRTPGWAEAHIRNQMDYVQGSREANDVVFVGDSTTSGGIQTELFEKRTGLRAYNLGLPGFVGIDSSLRLIELYLENHPALKLIVYAAHPKDYGLDQPNWEDIRPRFTWSYGVWSGAPPFEPSFSPAYYVREGLRIAAGELRGGQEHYFGNWVSDWKQQVLRQRGFYENPGVLREDAQRQPAPEKQYAVSPWYARHMHALARITGERGISLMIQPTPAMIRTRQEEAGALFTWLQQFKDQYPHVSVSDRELQLYAYSDFTGDALHMNISGAGRFTAFLAERVKMLYPGMIK